MNLWQESSLEIADRESISLVQISAAFGEVLDSLSLSWPECGSWVKSTALPSQCAAGRVSVEGNYHDCIKGLYFLSVLLGIFFYNGCRIQYIT